MHRRLWPMPPPMESRGVVRQAGICGIAIGCVRYSNACQAALEVTPGLRVIPIDDTSDKDDKHGVPENQVAVKAWYPSEFGVIQSS